jgi:hypothetical protein
MTNPPTMQQLMNVSQKQLTHSDGYFQAKNFRWHFALRNWCTPLPGKLSGAIWRPGSNYIVCHSNATIRAFELWRSTQDAHNIICAYCLKAPDLVIKPSKPLIIEPNFKLAHLLENVPGVDTNDKRRFKLVNMTLEKLEETIQLLGTTKVKPLADHFRCSTTNIHYWLKKREKLLTSEPDSV